MAQANQPSQPNMVQRAVQGIESFFRPEKELSPISGQQQLQQQNYGQQQQNNQQPQGTTNRGATNDPETLQDPLAASAGLFDNSPQKDKDGKEIVAPQAPSFNLDPKVIGDAASKLSFTNDLPEELATKLANGESLSSQEMLQAMDHVGRRAYSTAMQHNSGLTDKFVNMRLSHESQGLPQQVKRLLAQTHVLSDEAIQSNPALKEHMEVIADRLAAKHKDQSPEWIAQQTRQYFIDMAKALNPGLAETTPQSERQRGQDMLDGATRNEKGEVFDWSAYINKDIRNRA